LKQRKILSDGEIGLVFFNTEVIAEQQSRFLSAMSGLNSDTAESTQLLLTSLSKFKEYFILHAQFISNYSSATALASRLLSENSTFSDFSIELTASSDACPWFGVTAALNVPVRNVVHIWLLLTRIASLLPKTEMDKFNTGFAPIKDSVDQIKLHQLLEQSTWSLVEMLQQCERLDAVWLLKPYRSYVSKRKISLMSSKEISEVVCYLLSDSSVFVSPAGKFLGKVSIRQTRLFRTKQGDVPVAGQDVSLCWLRQDLISERSLFLGFSSEVDALDWADLHDRLQAHLLTPLSQKVKIDGKAPSLAYSSASAVSPTELIIVGATGANSISVLDLSANNCSVRPIAKLSAVTHHTTVVDGSALLIFGGIIDGVVSATLWRVNLGSLACKSVKATRDVPDPRAGHSACVVGRSMYIFGGFTRKKKKSTFLGDLYSFDMDTRVWIRLSSPDGFTPSARAHHACTTYGKKIFIWGGELDGRSLSDLVSYDTETGMWRTESPSGVGPTPRHSCCTTAFGHYLVLYGGMSGDIVYEDVFLLDLVSLVWVKIMFPTFMPRCFGSYVHIVGGRAVSSDGGDIADLSSASIIFPSTEYNGLLRVPLSSRWWITPQNGDSRLKDLQEAQMRSDTKNKRLSAFMFPSLGLSFHHYRSSATKTATFNSIQQTISESSEKETVADKIGGQLEMALRHRLPVAAAFISKKVLKSPEFLEIPTTELNIRTTLGMIHASYEFKTTCLVVNVEGSDSQSFNLLNSCCVIEESLEVSIMPAVSPIAAARLRFPTEAGRDQFVRDFSQRRAIFIADVFSNGGLISIPCVQCVCLPSCFGAFCSTKRLELGTNWTQKSWYWMPDLLF
jgi:hypothetical protein